MLGFGFPRSLKQFNMAFESLALEQRRWIIVSDSRRKLIRNKFAQRIKSAYIDFLSPHRYVLWHHALYSICLCFESFFMYNPSLSLVPHTAVESMWQEHHWFATNIPLVARWSRENNHEELLSRAECAKPFPNLSMVSTSQMGIHCAEVYHYLFS